MTLRTTLAVWSDWDAAAWGRALFQHYFAGHDPRPVSRLAISPEELAKVANAPENEATTVRDAFLQAVRCSPGAFRRQLSIASLTPGAWDRREVPAFLAYLLFTCFAAASLDADIADERIFRERVRQLLGHAQGTSYAFEELSLLWEAFASWLQQQHDEGAPYRALSLPNRGRMRRIGYSVRLAFPRREDRVRLRDTLADAGVGTNPTVPEAFQAIDRARDRFSSDFKQVFDTARAALASGREIPDLHALWSAVLEAAGLTARVESRGARGRFQLLAQEDELGRVDPFIVSDGVQSETRGGVRFSRLDESFEEFDHVLCAIDGSTALIAKLVLMDALDDKVPGLGASPIPRAVREGVLLLRQLDSATWELAVRRPSEGRVRALVRTHLSDAFLGLFGGAKRHSRETAFDGWREVGPFDVTELRVPRHYEDPELAVVRCLQLVEIGPQLHLLDGIRVDGGYLGLGELLPEVHCAEADHAALFSLSECSGELRPSHLTTLERSRGRPGVFGWPARHDDLEGAYVLAGTRDGRVVAPREVVFHARGLSHDYRPLTHPERWLVEDSASDVVAAGPVSDGILTEAGSTEAARPIDVDSTEGLRVFTNRSVDDVVEHDRLVETLSAISVARKGIAEAELIEILGKLVRQAPGFAVWAILRGWVEAGYLDCLTRRQWRGRVYFARRPRLILIPDADMGTMRGVLHGLAPYHLRTALRDTFSRGGATPLPAASLSASVPALQAWRFESLEHATAAMAEIGKLDTAGVREPRELAGDFNAAVSDEAPLPPGYECQRIWDWAVGGFRRAYESIAADDVRIEYHTRTNGPDRYVVATAEQRRTTISRSWALLDGFRRAGRRAFAPAGSLALVRHGDDGPQVPLPIARAIGVRAGIVGGPAESETLGRHYAYATEGPSVQRWLLAWLRGAKDDEVVVRRFAWLRAATSVRSTDAVSLPADLRRRLRDLHSLPDALSMAERRIPRHLLAHVRRAVDLAET